MQNTGGYSREREIDKPLGQDIKSGKPPKARPSRAGLLGGLVAIAVAGGAGWIAMTGERPFRAIEPEKPGPQAEQQAAATPQPEAQPATTEGGPAIIKVPQDAGDATPPPLPEPSNSVIVIRDPSAVGQDLRTAHLPDRALIEQTEFGPLPVMGADGRRPFDVYARPWSGTRGARVAIVIGGMGLSQTGTQTALRKLPPEITVAFAPQGNSVGRWMQEARRAGREVIMQVPLEPFDYPRINPGRNTLTVEASPEQNLDNLYWALGRTTNYTGIMNHMGARFLSDEKALKPVMDQLARRGLMFLDDGTYARSLASDLAARDRVPFAAGDLVIDASQDRETILKSLDQLEATARARGYAIGTGSAFDLTVDAVTAWVAEAKRRGIEIVPVSALAADPKG